MASVFKKKRTVNGETKESKHWWIEYRNADGETERVKGFTDKTQTYSLAAKLENEAQDGRRSRHRNTPLADHIETFKTHLRSENRSPKHVSQTLKRIRAIVDGCEFMFYRDIDIVAVREWLAEQRAADELSKKRATTAVPASSSFVLGWSILSGPK